MNANAIIYQPKSGLEVRSAIYSHPPIYMYSKLVSLMRRYGAKQVLYKMASQNRDALILVQDPKNPRSGHWTSLSFHPDTKEAFFFSSYGGKPDVEKNQWIARDGLLRSGQDLNVFNDGLKQLMVEDGWLIHYNQIPYQKVGDNTATCGIWCAAFINSDMNPDEFYDYVKRHHQTPLSFYRQYFM